MAPVRHGHNRRGNPSPTYRSWYNMLQRCENPKNTSYADYGGRGITVCDEWHDFAAFLRDMGVRPDTLTIERKDVNGPYCASNCCWADLATQARTRRFCRSRKLDEQTVRQIRQLKGSAINAVIAKRFGVTKSVVAKIYRGELWVGVGL